MGQTPIGLYLHIPFCVRKCPYCDFYSLAAEDALMDAYADALVAVMERHPFGRLQADTLYLGGGTPSILGPRRLDRILNEAARCFSLAGEAEITLEANPGTVDLHILHDLRGSGYNRISFGVQSLGDSQLAALGRLHNGEEARTAIEWAAQAGFANISADLMLGTPGQDETGLDDTLSALGQLPLSHISAYMLKIEEGTPFAKNGTARLCPDEDLTAGLYLQLIRSLEQQGFYQYEISNFALTGRECRHNLKYWQCREYLGLGPAAHSYLQGKRFYFPPDLTSFLSVGNPFALLVQDGEGGGWEEYAMLRLRLAQGLDLKELQEQFAMDTREIAKKAEQLAKGQLLRFADNRISLTAQGMLLSNAVTGHLLF